VKSKQQPYKWYNVEQTNLKTWNERMKEDREDGGKNERKKKRKNLGDGKTVTGPKSSGCN
jgi:hypothetical protein